MNNVEQAYNWLSLLVIWTSVLVLGGGAVAMARCAWTEFVRPHWIKRLRRIERGRMEQSNA
jgi:hypothetical protein